MENRYDVSVHVRSSLSLETCLEVEYFPTAVLALALSLGIGKDGTKKSKGKCLKLPRRTHGRLSM